MTLLFADGFEDGLLAWNLTGSPTNGAARFGNGLTAVSGTNVAEVGFAATAGPIIIGCAFKPVGAGSILGFMAASLNPHVGLTRGSSGEIVAYRGSSPANVLGTSAVNVLPASAWSYVELKITVHDTTGTVVVRVNGVEVINATGLDTKDSTGTTTASARLGNTSAVATASGNAWDDVYICDAAGSYNNAFLGDLQVEHLRPASDDTAQFLGSDGNSTDNYALVDEAGTYSGSDYVGSSTVGHRDLYVPGASSRPGTSPVHGVVVVAVAQKTDAGVRTAKLNVKEGSGGSVRQSADLGLPTSFGELRAVFERKGDGSQFTVADVNALRMGIEVAT